MELVNTNESETDLQKHIVKWPILGTFCIWCESGDDLWEICLLKLPGLLGASWVPPGCLLGASWVPPGCLLGASWVLPGSPLTWDVSGVASAGNRDHSDPEHKKWFEKGCENNCKVLFKMVYKLDLKCYRIRLGTVFFIVEITLISEGSVFLFIMFPGRIGYFKIPPKPCRVSQNRGSAVSPRIRNFSQKVLKLATPMASKIIENPKNPHPGTLTKRT